VTGDMGELFNAARAEGQLRRARNRQGSAQILRDRGIEFETKNDGAHLVVRHGGKVADLWPGTGKYRVRKPGGKGERYRRGVFNLLRDIGHKDNAR
jgi:hypothetical protein